MSALMIRADVKPEHVSDLETTVERLFAAIHRAQPGGIRYASCRLGQSESFAVLLQLDEETDNPLTALPEFQEFQSGLQNWLAGPPSIEPLTVIGSYRLF